MRHGERELLTLRASFGVSVRAIAFIARRHLEGFASVDREANLTAAAVVVAESCCAPVLLGACCPRSCWSAIGFAKKMMIVTARVVPASAVATAIVRVRQIGIFDGCSVRVVGGIEGSWVVKLEVRKGVACNRQDEEERESRHGMLCLLCLVRKIENVLNLLVLG